MNKGDKIGIQVLVHLCLMRTRKLANRMFVEMNLFDRIAENVRHKIYKMRIEE